MNNDLISAARAALNYIEEPPAKLWPAGTLHRITINLRTALAAAEAQPVGEPVALQPSTMKRGGFYNWKSQPDRLIYLRRFDGWHQFKKIGDPREVWCEVQDSDLHMLEETAPPAQPAAQPMTDAQIEALVLETVYENDERIPYRDYWVREIGMPFARAIEAAHGIGSQP